MLSKILDFFFRRVLNRHRLLFRYWDGTQFVSADPFVLLRKLVNTDKFDPDADLKKLKYPDPKIVTEKIGFIAEGIREIFGLRPFEKKGLTELECVQLLMMFSEYLDTVKKNGASSPITSQLSTGEAEKPAASSPGENDTNENSASTSTPSGSPS
jgi:hypothetical protein